MMKELVQQIEQLINEGLNENTNQKLESIHTQYLQLKKNVPTIIGEENEEVQEVAVDEDDLKYQELYKELQNKIEKNIIAKATNENNNLIAKREVIAELKLLAENPMDSLGEAFKKFNELKDKWRNTGNVPEKHYLSLQRDYRFYNEQFFYTIKIFKDLQEHDLKKNAQLKSVIIEKLKVLSQQENIKELESGVKNLQNEWDEIGPTIDTEWEKLRDAFKELLNTIYQKIQSHHHTIYESMVTNLAQKNELIEKLSEVVNKEFTNTKSFEDATKEVISIQEAYKKIGFAKKKENEDAWTKFRDISNSFFNKKKLFYDELKSKYEGGKNAKDRLIEKVAALKNSYDWANTTQKIISLQKEWKESPSAGYQTDNKLWEIFRSHCDDFFNAKKNHFEQQQNDENENLSKKLQLVTRIQSYTASDNIVDNLNQIQAFKTEWSEIGYVPKNEKEKITNLYQDAINGLQKKLNLSNTQLDEMKFNSLVDTMKTNPEAAQIIRAEKIRLKEELNKLENSISQKENNLLFFAKSKNANSMLDDVKSQLEKEKQLALSLKEKIKKLS